jgi:hypothetical protein
MKFSNILKAYKTTIIGLAIPVVTAIVQVLTAGPVSWKVIGSAVAAALLLAVTDLLNEAKKKA